MEPMHGLMEQIQFPRERKSQEETYNDVQICFKREDDSTDVYWGEEKCC